MRRPRSRSAPTRPRVRGLTETRAELAVDDLERAGGFDRAYLVVATTTGSGWVDPAAVDTIEYITGGDSAIVAIQYSYLPSWISYLVDQERAREAGRELFDAVYGRWASLPDDRRPKLLVFGESLGSFGGETAFSGEYDLHNRTSGAVFAGPPNFNTLYREFVADRDVGSPEVAPVYRRRPHGPLRRRARPDPSSPPAPRGTTRGCSTCSTRPTRSSGGARTWCCPRPTGWTSRLGTTSSTR